MRIELRPVTAEDRDFLFSVYASTREDVAQAPWSDEDRTAFLQMQFEAQSADYAARFPNADYSIIVADGVDVGRIWVDRGPNEIRLLDIALLPERRNRGNGRVLLERLIDEARLTFRPLRHSVYKTNIAALRFYGRLGFEVIEDFEMYVLMEWRAGEAKRDD